MFFQKKFSSYILSYWLISLAYLFSPWDSGGKNTLPPWKLLPFQGRPVFLLTTGRWWPRFAFAWEKGFRGILGAVLADLLQDWIDSKPRTEVSGKVRGFFDSTNSHLYRSCFMCFLEVFIYITVCGMEVFNVSKLFCKISGICWGCGLPTGFLSGSSCLMAWDWDNVQKMRLPEKET